MEFGNSKSKQKLDEVDSLEAQARVVQGITNWRWQGWGGNRRGEKGNYAAQVGLYTRANRKYMLIYMEH
jgi:hypothetical protein